MLPSVPSRKRSMTGDPEVRPKKRAKLSKKPTKAPAKKPPKKKKAKADEPAKGVRGMHYFLTYPKCPLSPETCLKHLCELGEVQK